jgi:hypothetical protein
MLKQTILVMVSLILCLSSEAKSYVPNVTQPHFKKVLIIIFENANYEKAMAQSYFKKLSEEGALFTNFNGEAHPSQANYVALIAGDTYGIKNDKNVDLNGSHIGDLLDAKGLTWKAYAEKYPGNCFLGTSSGKYARKHLPFISFKNIQDNPERCANLVDGAAFDADLAAGTLPDYALYVPDLKNDGHDTGVSFADQWLHDKFGSLFKDADFMRDRIVMITFDESQSTNPNHIYTVLYGDSVKAGSVVSIRHDHYSLLRLIEDEMGLGSLNMSDAQASPITGIWQ